MVLAEEIHDIIWDEASGEVLDPKLSTEARGEEIEEFKKHNVYTKVPDHEAWQVTKKGPIGVRWVDVNKGDRVHPEYRSRLVEKEIKRSVNLDLFAATPPWEAKKLLFGLAVTKGAGWFCDKKSGHKTDFIDIRCAYFHAAARRPVYVQLPPEDYSPGQCGRLIKSMYGTRDAAQNSEIEYTEFLNGIGFTVSSSVGCMFSRGLGNIKVVVHGDDFTLLVITRLVQSASGQ